MSHLRWRFVYQRPQHLMSRCAREHRVIFYEEPLFGEGEPELALHETECGVLVAVPHLPAGISQEAADGLQRRMTDRLIEDLPSPYPVLWYYTPMALAFTHHVRGRAVVYDCMDELSLLRGAPPGLVDRERWLLRRADVVFTGGHSLYERKRTLHHNIHPFPSSVDVPHFASARDLVDEPPDQAEIPHPRAGFFGVIDERLDIGLLDELAASRPDLHLVMIGPIAKIDPAVLPRRPNLYWLGSKSYEALPAYLAGWDVALLPFARNEATRYISPTKTLEYLAAGTPVVSTSIRDVVTPYGDEGLAWIADTATELAQAIDAALASDRVARLAHVDTFLADLSWDRTWQDMWAHVEHVLARRELRSSGVPAASATAGTGAGAALPGLSRREA